jgi:hypothetical protein
MFRVVRLLPELEGNEQLYVARLMAPMTDEQAEHFAFVYRERRKKPGLTLGLTFLAFAGACGVQRFYLGQAVWGLVYLLTFGLFFLGTVHDLLRHRHLTERRNRRLADEVAALVRHVMPGSRHAPETASSETAPRAESPRARRRPVAPEVPMDASPAPSAYRPAPRARRVF